MMLQMTSGICPAPSAKKGHTERDFGVVRNLVALLILTTMVTWFTADLLTGGKVPFYRDLGTYFYPAKLVLARSFQAGEIPFWSKQLGMGFPFLASPQSAVFYPPNIVFTLLPFFSAVRFLFVAHYLIGAVGAYMLCVRWGAPRPVALLGASLFAFGGVTVSLGNLMDHFQATVWMPWVLFCVDKCVRRLSRGNFVVLGLVWLMQLLAGSPEVCLMTLGLSFLVGLRAKADGERLSVARLLWVPCGSFLAAAGLGMVQVAPSLELLSASWRSESIPYAKAVVWSLDPWRLINFFFLDKEVNLYRYDGLHLFLGKEPPLLLSLYLGAISLPGVSLWITTSSKREKAILLGLISGSVLATGGHMPVHRVLFEYLPVLARIRFPEKFLLLTFALLWYMTLKGLASCLRDEADCDARSFYIPFAVAPLFFLGVYVFCRLHFADLILLVPRRTGSPLYDVGNLRTASALIVNLERQAALVMVISVLLLLGKKGKLRREFVAVLLLLTTFVDLSSTHRSYHFALSPAVIEKTPRILFSAEPGLGRIFYLLQLGVLHPSTYAVPREDFVHTVGVVFSSLIPNSGVFFGFEYMQEMDALRRKPYDWLLREGGDLGPGQLFRLLGTLNVAYVASPQSFTNEELRLIGSFPDNALWLYGIRRVVPRTYIAAETVMEKQPRKVIERLVSLTFNPTRQVIL